MPEIWLPDAQVRRERELARFRLHLVKHRSALKNRVHASLIAHGVPNPSSDLFGAGGRARLARLRLPQPWQATTSASLLLIDQLDEQIQGLERQLRLLGAQHRYIPLLMTCPGIGWVLGFTIAAEIGDIARFPSLRKLAGYSGLCPRVNQSGARDRRGPLSKHGPRYLRWALVEAATTACRHPAYRARYQRTKPAWANNAAPKSPRSSSPARSPRPSGTCSPTTNPSPRQAPQWLWPPDGPL